MMYTPFYCNVRFYEPSGTYVTAGIIFAADSYIGAMFQYSTWEAGIRAVSDYTCLLDDVSTTAVRDKYYTHATNYTAIKKMLIAWGKEE